MKKTSSITLMTSGNLKKQILAYTFPILVGYLFQQLYNTADALIVGNFLGETALAAVTGVGSLTFLFIGFFTGFATGASVIVAREIGANNEDKTRRVVHTTVALGIVLSILMTVSGFFLCNPLLKAMGTPSDVLPLSNAYLRIYFLGSSAIVMYNMLVGILRAGGDSTHPLYYLVASSLINVVLDIVFITVFKMGVEGAAFATVISEILSMVLCWGQLVKEDSMIHLNFRNIRFHKHELKEILEYGLPTGLQGSVIDIANVLIQSYINSFGACAVAGIGAYSKVEGFMFLPVTSFSMAMTTFISQNIGARKYERARKGILFGIATSLTIIETIGVIIFFFAPVFIEAFNSNPEVVAYGVQRARTCALFFCLVGFSHVVSAIMRGEGRPVVPVIVMLVCWCAVRVTVLLTIGQFIHDIRLANWLYPITWSLSSIVYIMYLYNFHIFTPVKDED